MAVVNVNRNVPDPFYRYKMPKIIAKVEGKGNGIKTVIVNMPEVSKALSRPPTYPTKFFGCELGAQTQFDLKNDRYIVNGSHDSSKLQDLLDGFIKKFVLCPECDNPETNLAVKQRSQTISQRCIACGHQGQIDMRHKLTTFILKNPPDQDPNATTPAKDKKSKGKKGKKDDGDRNSPDGSKEECVEALNGDVVLVPEKREEVDDDEDWGEDTSDAAVQSRMLDLTDAAKSLALNDDLEKTQQERLDIFYHFVKNKNGKLNGLDKDILAEAERLDVKDKGPLILVELLFDSSILSQIKQNRVLFLRFTHENPKSQKYLLGGIEQLVGNVHRDTLLPKVPHILKAFYDLDIIDEEVILEWAIKPSKKYVSKEISQEIHNKAEPFIKWLKEAEEDSEESEEDELEIVYSKSGKVGTETKTTPVASAPTTAAKQVEDDDDLDIDAI